MILQRVGAEDHVRHLGTISVPVHATKVMVMVSMSWLTTVEPVARSHRKRWFVTLRRGVKHADVDELRDHVRRERRTRSCALGAEEHVRERRLGHAVPARFPRQVRNGHRARDEDDREREAPPGRTRAG